MKQTQKITDFFEYGGLCDLAIVEAEITKNIKYFRGKSLQRQKRRRFTGQQPERSSASCPDDKPWMKLLISAGQLVIVFRHRFT